MIKWHKSINEAHALTIEHSVFSIMAGLIVEMFFVLFSIYNGLKMSEYEAYWLMSFALISSWGMQEIIIIIIFEKANKQV